MQENENMFTEQYFMKTLHYKPLKTFCRKQIVFSPVSCQFPLSDLDILKTWSEGGMERVKN